MSAQLPSIPEAVSSLSSLRFFARSAVEGTLSGVHRSGLFGSSIEFADHKPYSAGDDLRHIDWKVFGRADKYYLKRFEDETNLRAYIVLDSSSSMDFGSLGYRKIDYAAVLSATLAYLLIQQQDLVGLVQFGASEQIYTPPRGRMPHFQILSEILHHVQPGGRMKVPEALSYLRERIHRKALVLVLSDFLASQESITGMGKIFDSQSYDVHWFHLLDPAEIEFPYRDRVVFRGLEGEEDLEVNGREAARQYKKELQAWIDFVRETALRHTVRHRFVRTDEAINHVLASTSS